MLFRSHKVFYRPEKIRSQYEQKLIDDNAQRLIDEGKAFYNPSSKHNIAQVIVNRFDKDGVPIKGKERICLDLRAVNKALEHYEFPIPRIETILRTLINSSVFSELDLSAAFNQLKVDERHNSYSLLLHLREKHR